MLVSLNVEGALSMHLAFILDADLMDATIDLQRTDSTHNHALHKAHHNISNCIYTLNINVGLQNYAV